LGELQESFRKTFFKCANPQSLNLSMHTTNRAWELFKRFKETKSLLALT